MSYYFPPPPPPPPPGYRHPPPYPQIPPAFYPPPPQHHLPPFGRPAAMPIHTFRPSLTQPPFRIETEDEITDIGYLDILTLMGDPAHAHLPPRYVHTHTDQIIGNRRKVVAQPRVTTSSVVIQEVESTLWGTVEAAEAGQGQGDHQENSVSPARGSDLLALPAPPAASVSLSSTASTSSALEPNFEPESLPRQPPPQRKPQAKRKDPPVAEESSASPRKFRTTRDRLLRSIGEKPLKLSTLNQVFFSPRSSYRFI